MKIRTCPYCNYKYSRYDYLKRLLFKVLWSEWNCHNCNQKITFEVKRRLNVGLSFGLWLAALSIVRSSFEMSWVLWIVYGIILLIGTFYIFTFDNFAKTRKTD